MNRTEICDRYIRGEITAQQRRDLLAALPPRPNYFLKAWQSLSTAGKAFCVVLLLALSIYTAYGAATAEPPPPFDANATAHEICGGDRKLNMGDTAAARAAHLQAYQACRITYGN